MSATGDWFDDDRLWVESYPTMFPESSFETARREVDSILELAGCRRGRLLDLACGPGRHAVPLALRGFEVTGVDRSRFLLEKARTYAEADNRRVLELRDMLRAAGFTNVAIHGNLRGDPYGPEATRLVAVARKG